MSRRDTIIVAVLINAGLLIILFASALKSNDEVSVVSATPKEKKVVDLASHSSAKSEMVNDEVDQLIKQFNEPKKDEPVVVVVPETPAVQIIKENSPMKSEEFPEVKLAASAKNEGDAPLKITVKKGDVLEKIAKRHGSTVDAIMKANHLPDTRLKIGQVLTVPQLTHSSEARPKDLEHDTKYYIVKHGDNPWTIAVKNHIKVADLLRLNQMDEEKARHLKPGDQIRIK